MYACWIICKEPSSLAGRVCDSVPWSLETNMFIPRLRTRRWVRVGFAAGLAGLAVCLHALLPPEPNWTIETEMESFTIDRSGFVITLTHKDKVPSFWDGRTGEPLHASLPRENWHWMAMSPDRRHLVAVSGAAQQTACWLDKETGKLSKMPPVSFLPNNSNRVAQWFSPHRPLMILRSPAGPVQVIEPGRDALVIAGELNEFWAENVDFSTDGKLAFVWGRYGWLVVWDLDKREARLEILGPGPRYAVLSPDKKYLVLGDIRYGNVTDPLVCIDVASWKEVWRVSPVEGYPRLISPDGRWVLLYAYNKAMLRDLATGRECIPLSTSKEYGFPAVFSPDGRFLALPHGENDNASADVYDARTGKFLQTAPMPGFDQFHFTAAGNLLWTVPQWDNSLAKRHFSTVELRGWDVTLGKRAKVPWEGAELQLGENPRFGNNNRFVDSSTDLRRFMLVEGNRNVWPRWFGLAPLSWWEKITCWVRNIPESSLGPKTRQLAWDAANDQVLCEVNLRDLVSAHLAEDGRHLVTYVHPWNEPGLLQGWDLPPRKAWHLIIGIPACLGAVVLVVRWRKNRRRKKSEARPARGV
jgi:hypothetical protein